MWLGRAIRGLLAFLSACLPTGALWLLIVTRLESAVVAPERTPASPNPVKNPAWSPGPLDVLTHADPIFAGTIWLWLPLGGFTLLGLVLWAAGVLQPRTGQPTARPIPSTLKVISVALAAGVFLAMPWLYAWIKVLNEPPS